MGDVLTGIHATWEFESDSVLIRFERGLRTPKLFQALGALGERRIPHEALESVTLAPGKRGTVVLHAVPRAGADPLAEAAAGQLRQSVDPYRLVLPAEREPLAAYFADELRSALSRERTPDREEPAERYLVAAPEPPLHFKAYDGKASFDGERVLFRWFRTGASSAKWKAGDQDIPVADLQGVEWRSPDRLDGYLRLLRRDGTPPVPSAPGRTGAADGTDAVTRPDHDPAAVVFGLGYGPVHESLPFAAAVLEAIQGSTAGSRAAVPVLAAARRDPADVADSIRHLGDLHEAGLVTDEEFSAKKAELLAEL
ncbi:DUF4429 domain-containing protein [Streptomyces corynorhini]|uniref:DUF4429 domain-containing protein n=1 Tax=Streptomyces corynorhini TaxID=2282652 RepID=A0A370BF01_9ACTN|nr:DUF4429 domain-containing protein [Streptomyces corynorhini]RDG38969.1 DUF4429 domain-containing protein [Streptomyces corynorhini]